MSSSQPKECIVNRLSSSAIYTAGYNYRLSGKQSENEAEYSFSLSKDSVLLQNTFAPAVELNLCEKGEHTELHLKFHLRLITRIALSILLAALYIFDILVLIPSIGPENSMLLFIPALALIIVISLFEIISFQVSYKAVLREK